MNKNGYNCCWCCCSCENFKNDWGCGQEKEYHKCCKCEKEKEFPTYFKCEKEKEYNQCGCLHDNYSQGNCNYGFDNNSKYENSCGCSKSNYGYEKYNQSNFGWY